jgi:23S rRNA pseudouridine1911/1915/1917 synthase
VVRFVNPIAEPIALPNQIQDRGVHAIESIPGRHVWTVSHDDAGQRLDHFLSAHLTGHSRVNLQHLVANANVRVDGTICKSARKVRPGEIITAEIPAPVWSDVVPEDLPFDILYEDKYLAVINKPAGIVVHPGAGRLTGTLVAALLHRFGSLSQIGGPLRPGIVHRLDKGTSGALIVARDDVTHAALVKQFQSRKVQKTYLALLHGNVLEDSGRIELSVARDLQRRMRMTTRRDGRTARTDWRVILRFGSFTLVEAGLHTGRTHQIRVHFSAIGHPVVGDTLYGAPREIRMNDEKLPPLERNFLHALRIRFVHPVKGTPLDIRAPLPGDLRTFFVQLADRLRVDVDLIDATLKPYL